MKPSILSQPSFLKHSRSLHPFKVDPKLRVKTEKMYTSCFLLPASFGCVLYQYLYKSSDFSPLIPSEVSHLLVCSLPMKIRKRLARDVFDIFFHARLSSSWRHWYRLLGTKRRDPRHIFGRHSNVGYFLQTGAETEWTTAVCLFYTLHILIGPVRILRCQIPL